MSGTEGSRVGSRFGHYHLKRLLGRGGMGEVYEAQDTIKDRLVALKLMSSTISQNPVFRARMQREAYTAGRLTEPHVVPIHDYGEIDGQLYVDMRLIKGADLRAVLTAGGRLAPARAVAIVRQIADALDAAHESGVMHRDVKPENILLTGNDFAYLVDFGLARAASDVGLTTGTVGTWTYMAPERFTDDEVTFRADIYALACVLYECLTGSPPYRIDTVERAFMAHTHEPVPRPSRQQRGIAVGFDRVIAKGMAKNPAERYRSAGALALAAQDALAARDRDHAENIVHCSRAATLPGSAVAPEPTQRDMPAPTPSRHRVNLVIGPPIRVGMRPFGVALDPDARTVYVTKTGDNTVSVIDADTRAVTASIPVGELPWGVAVDPGARRVYVTNHGGDTVSVIGTDTRAVTSTLRVGKDPVGVAVDPGARRVYVTNQGDNTVSVIDADTCAVTATISVGAEPRALTLDPVGHTVYVAHILANIVSVIDAHTGTVTSTIAVGRKPSAVAVDTVAHTIYVSNSADATVSAIDADSCAVTATIGVGKDPAGVVADPGSRTVYVANLGDNTVSVIDADTYTVTATVGVGRKPNAVAVDPGSGTVYTANRGDNTVSVIGPSA